MRRPYSGVAKMGVLSVSSLGYAQTPDLLDTSGLFEWLALLSVFAWITTFAVFIMREEIEGSKESERL